ncbi:hypothetical protein DdX_15981 [Ditylenchus destructor]|uniref:Uncharacterized protein n=1 Tax=Ditylenchus destructor TaxID=166010 RepID=A0AAD4R0D6_9BILA|nr:hypothetical protein DdX_15981 [Ditylenchus destructor]
MARMGLIPSILTMRDQSWKEDQVGAKEHLILKAILMELMDLTTKKKTKEDAKEFGAVFGMDSEMRLILKAILITRMGLNLNSLS